MNIERLEDALAAGAFQQMLGLLAENIAGHEDETRSFFAQLLVQTIVKTAPAEARHL